MIGGQRSHVTVLLGSQDRDARLRIWHISRPSLCCTSPAELKYCLYHSGSAESPDRGSLLTL